MQPINSHKERVLAQFPDAICIRRKGRYVVFLYCPTAWGVPFSTGTSAALAWRAAAVKLGV